MRRVGIAVGIALAVLLLTGLLGTAFGVLLRVLAALLLALPLRAGAEWLHRRTRLPNGLALAVVVLLVLGLLGGMGWLFSARASASRPGQLREQLPEAYRSFQERIARHQLGRMAGAGKLRATRRLLGGGSEWLGRATGIFSTTIGVLADVYVVVFLALVHSHSAQAVPGRHGDAGAQGRPRPGQRSA